MDVIEQTIGSSEVAEMIGKAHSNLVRDIRRYEKQFNQCNIAPVDFFHESTYTDKKGEIRSCYRITKKGCEFIAHKLTGTKGTIFTAQYINRFHEMENSLKRKQEPDLPWFIRDFKREGKIMLFRDFKTITGIELSGVYTAWERPDRLVGGVDYNGWGWKCDNEKFKAEYGFDYGDDDCMMYLYFRGIGKAIRAIENDIKDRKKLSLDAKKLILDGIQSTEGKRESVVNAVKGIEHTKQNPIQITLILNQNGIETKVY